MRRIQIKIRRGRDKRWYCIIKSSNGEVMWVTPRGYARTHHAEKPIRAIYSAFACGKFTIQTARSTAQDHESIEEAKKARRSA